MPYLFLEVSDGVLVSEGEEVEDAVFDVVILEVVHQVCAISLHTNTIQYKPNVMILEVVHQVCAVSLHTNTIQYNYYKSNVMILEVVHQVCAISLHTNTIQVKCYDP